MTFNYPIIPEEYQNLQHHYELEKNIIKYLISIIKIQMYTYYDKEIKISYNIYWCIHTFCNLLIWYLSILETENSITVN